AAAGSAAASSGSPVETSSHQVSGPPEPVAECCAGPRSRGTAERETRDVERPLLPVRPGLSLMPATAPLTKIEVLRGRAISIWPRAFAGGREIPVRAWSLRSGDPGAAQTTTGVGAAPFQTSWTRPAAPGAAYAL